MLPKTWNFSLLLQNSVRKMRLGILLNFLNFGEKFGFSKTFDKKLFLFDKTFSVVPGAHRPGFQIVRPQPSQLIDHPAFPDTWTVSTYGFNPICCHKSVISSCLNRSTMLISQNRFWRTLLAATWRVRATIRGRGANLWTRKNMWK